MPKRKQPELKPKEQIKRFKALAREVGISEDEAEIARTFKQIARAKPDKQKKK